MSATMDIGTLVGQYVFPIAVSVYLLYERTKTFKEESDRWAKYSDTILSVLRANTEAITELRGTVQKLCEVVNGNGKP